MARPEGMCRTPPADARSVTRRRNAPHGAKKHHARRMDLCVESSLRACEMNFGQINYRVLFRGLDSSAPSGREDGCDLHRLEAMEPISFTMSNANRMRRIKENHAP
jgi:hypothetical protein